MCAYICNYIYIYTVCVHAHTFGKFESFGPMAHVRITFSWDVWQCDPPFWPLIKPKRSKSDRRWIRIIGIAGEGKIAWEAKEGLPGSFFGLWVISSDLG